MNTKQQPVAADLTDEQITEIAQRYITTSWVGARQFPMIGQYVQFARAVIAALGSAPATPAIVSTVAAILQRAGETPEDALRMAAEAVQPVPASEPVAQWQTRETETLQQFAESQRPIPADMAAILQANMWDLCTASAPATQDKGEGA